MGTMILPTAARFLMPLLILFSLFLLLRGHNEPGGGFAGGLVAAAAFVLNAIAVGVADARRTAGIDPRMLIGLGLLLAAGSGVVALLVGRPFLTGLWIDLSLPGGGKLSIGTPLFFDIGVYLVVLGITVTIIFSLMEEESDLEETAP
jgi:multicomponent Na+:H+ antiporter subunit B